MLDENSKKILDYLKENPKKEFNITDLLALGLPISQILECTSNLESKGYIYILSNKRNSAPRYKLRLIKYSNTI